MGQYTRRQFLRVSAMAGAAAVLPLKFGVSSAQAFYNTPSSTGFNGIPLFKTALRGVGPGGIPVAMPDAWSAPVTGVKHYSILIGQFQDQIIKSGYGFGPTTLWGYVPTKGLGGYTKPTHLGGIIVGQRGTPIQITFRNLLRVNQHIVPVDTTIAGANQAINRTAIHLHGGLVPWISDGGPFDWFDPYNGHGNSFLNNKVLNPMHIGGSAEYYYPLNQSARFMWYHDHAIGITRLNAYAGIASGMIIRDSFEANLITQGLPNFVEAGGNEIPLIFQDKIFVGPNIATSDPKWSNINLQKVTKNPGSLWYAHTYEPNQLDGSGRWDLGPGGLTPLPDPSCVPEFFGDTMLVNGTVFPEATVQARRYRLRLLNACNARFLNLQLYIDDGSPDGITLDSFGKPTNAPFVNLATGDSSFLQIGTEGGFLSTTTKVPCSQPFTFLTPPDPITGQIDPSQIVKSLIVAPAERPDLIVDFSLVPKNLDGSYKNVILYNDAPAPFPSGDDRNDYFPGWNVNSGLFGVGNPVNGTTKPGFGPNTRVLMRFKVGSATGTPDSPLSIGPSTNLTAGIDGALTPWGLTTPPPIPPRFLSLNEYFDEYGRLIQIIGNGGAPYGSPLENSASYLNYGPAGLPQTVGSTWETVNSGDTEVWEVFNATGDVHPMHFHLVNVQIINRQLFDVANLSFNTFTGPVIPPEPNELGWKETVPMYPGTVTRVIMKFDLPTIVNAKGNAVDLRFAGGGKLGTPPPSPRTGFNEYVWHCHILEHEEHDMMHALVVK
jgi:spore coat protein A, manganese oxidase